MDESLRTRLETDVKAAMRSGDAVRRETIRWVLAQLKNAEIEKRAPLDDDESMALLQTQAKRMSEAIDQYRAGNRQDLADKEIAQLAIVKSYLPAELDDEQLASIAQSVVAETGATSAKDMASVMPIVIERVAKRADGKRISAAVRTALANAGS